MLQRFFIKMQTMEKYYTVSFYFGMENVINYSYNYFNLQMNEMNYNCNQFENKIIYVIT